ncbi:hypothetical protein ACWDZ8_31000 [Streptomyces sp. NPDC003233]
MAGRRARRSSALAVAVYLLDEDHAELHLALIGGSPPSFFTLPGWMGLDAPYPSTCARASGQPAVLVDPDPPEADEHHVPPYPYVALSAPATDADRRFGALTVLRLETFGTFRATEHADLQEIGNERATTLVQLAENGAAIAAGPTPMLVPVGSDPDTSICTPGWRVPGVPVSAGTSLMYPLWRLDDLLNQATTMEAFVGAARYCLMSRSALRPWCWPRPARAVCGCSGTAEPRPAWSAVSMEPNWTPEHQRPRQSVARPQFISHSRSTALTYPASTGRNFHEGLR